MSIAPGTRTLAPASLPASYLQKDPGRTLTNMMTTTKRDAWHVLHMCPSMCVDVFSVQMRACGEANSTTESVLLFLPLPFFAL